MLFRCPNTVKTVEELKDYYEKGLFYFHDTDINAYGKEFVEGYFVDGTVSEEEFLEYCEYVDGELYDDYFGDSEQWYRDVQRYIEDMQRITGKIPASRHVEYQFLALKTGPEGKLSSRLWR